MRRIGLAVGILALAACDTMIMDRMVIAPPSPPVDEALTVVRETLQASGLTLFHGPSAATAETWRWRDPSKPPGLSAAITQVGDEVHVRLSQDLYGPIGPTDKYRSVKQALLETTRARFGKKSVRVE